MGLPEGCNWPLAKLLGHHTITTGSLRAGKAAATFVGSWCQPGIAHPAKSWAAEAQGQPQPRAPSWGWAQAEGSPGCQPTLGWQELELSEAQEPQLGAVSTGPGAGPAHGCHTAPGASPLLTTCAHLARGVSNPSTLATVQNSQLLEDLRTRL